MSEYERLDDLQVLLRSEDVHKVTVMPFWAASSDHLVIPCYRLSTYGFHAFSVATPVCWNALILVFKVIWSFFCLLCFDAVGWAAGRASGL